MIIQPEQIGAGIPGAWVGGSEAPPSEGMAWPWGVRYKGLCWAVAPAAAPLPTALLDSFIESAGMDLNAGSTTLRFHNLGQVAGLLQASNHTFIPPGIGGRVK